MSYGNYKTPEGDGLVSVAGIDDGGGYDWDQTDVWQDTVTGWFYIYHDSGCSCNGPYDDYSGISDLEGPFRSVPELLGETSNVDLIEQILAWERRN